LASSQSAWGRGLSTSLSVARTATFASHLIIDLGLDPAQIIRTRMAASPFARLLEPTTAQPGATVLKLP
jgi:hypothetical protein